MEYSKVKANPHRPTAAAALKGCTSHEDPLPAHTLPRTFLTASPPWYGNLRQLSPSLETPAKGSGLCPGCPEEPSVQSRHSQGVRNSHPAGDLGRIQTLRISVVVFRGMESILAQRSLGLGSKWGPRARRHPVLCLGCSSQTSMWLSLCCHSGLNSAVTPRMRPSLSPWTFYCSNRPILFSL